MPKLPLREFPPGTHVLADDGTGKKRGIIDPAKAWMREPGRKTKELEGYVWVRFLDSDLPNDRAFFIEREKVRRDLPTLQVYDDE